jgi:hypothetical protein
MNGVQMGRLIPCRSRTSTHACALVRATPTILVVCHCRVIQARSVAADAGAAEAASAPPVRAVAPATPMTAFRTLADVRVQCSFDQADAALLAALVLNLRGSLLGFCATAPNGLQPGCGGR